MAEIAQIEFVKSELESLITRYKRDRDRHKRNALRVKLATALLAAGATVLLGWQETAIQTILKNIALVLNASITVLVAYEVFFEPRKLWVRETLALSKFKDIQRDLQFDLAQKRELHDDKLLCYKSRITEVLSTGLDDWVKDKLST